MRHLSRLTTLLAVFCVAAASAHAQGFRVESKSPPASPPGSETFTSLDGGFTVALPRQVSEYEPVSYDTPKGRATGDSFVWHVGGTQFHVTYTDAPAGPDAAEMAKAAVGESVEALVAAVTSKGDGTVLGRRDISLDGNAGQEVKVELPSFFMLNRLYAVGRRLYQITAVYGKDAKAQESASKALDSFRLLTPSESEAARQKNIDEATPAPLPQSPAVKKLKSDAEDEGLKGKVKTVFKETEDLTGTWAVGGRKPSMMDYYDERGQRTKSVLYDYKGNLRQVAVYGYLDGERVRSDKHLSYEYDPPPVAMPAAAADKPAPKTDPRYSWRYRYKYDERGRLVEDDWFGSGGRLLIRYTYKYEGDRKEELVYSEDGSLNQRYLFTLDAKGNEVEEINYDVRGGTVRSRESFGYEFDSKGNWTKQTTSKWAEKDGRGQFVPQYVTYRTITYY